MTAAACVLLWSLLVSDGPMHSEFIELRWCAGAISGNPQVTAPLQVIRVLRLVDGDTERRSEKVFARFGWAAREPRGPDVTIEDGPFEPAVVPPALGPWGRGGGEP